MRHRSEAHDFGRTVEILERISHRQRFPSLTCGLKPLALTLPSRRRSCRQTQVAHAFQRLFQSWLRRQAHGSITIHERKPTRTRAWREIAAPVPHSSDRPTVRLVGKVSHLFSLRESAYFCDAAYDRSITGGCPTSRLCKRNFLILHCRDGTNRKAN